MTLSVIKADVEGWVGHSTCCPEMLALAQLLLRKAVERGCVPDAWAAAVSRVGI